MTESVSQAALRDWITLFAQKILTQRDELDKLDAATGDGEHGSNLCKGMSAVLPLLSETTFTDVKEMFESIGMTVVNNVGGASGALYGTLFLRFSDAGDGRLEMGLDRLTEGFASGVAGISELGSCKPGDKTMLDAIDPAVSALRASQEDPLAIALARAAHAAEKGRDATAGMLARRGRGSYLGDRSLGHVDPGATSMAVLFHSLHEAVVSSA